MNMSHALRTPLNAIIGFSEALEMKVFGELNPKQEEYIIDIQNSGKEMLGLVNDILDMSKIEAGAMRILKTELNINLIIRDDKVMLPNGDTELLANDELYVVGKHAKVVKFEEYLN